MSSPKSQTNLRTYGERTIPTKVQGLFAIGLSGLWLGVCSFGTASIGASGRPESVMLSLNPINNKLEGVILGEEISTTFRASSCIQGAMQVQDCGCVVEGFRSFKGHEQC